MNPDSADLDFRDIEAVSEALVYAMSAGNGKKSRIYRTVDGRLFVLSDEGYHTLCGAPSGRLAWAAGGDGRAARITLTEADGTARSMSPKRA